MAIQIAGNQIKSGAVDTSQIANSAIEASKLDLSDNFVFTGQLRANVPSNTADVATKGYIDGIVGSGRAARSHGAGGGEIRRGQDPRRPDRQDRRRQGPEIFPTFHNIIDKIHRITSRRRRDDRPVAERPRPEL